LLNEVGRAREKAVVPASVHGLYTMKLFLVFANEFPIIRTLILSAKSTFDIPTPHLMGHFKHYVRAPESQILDNK
jgi:hypothetical protein